MDIEVAGAIAPGAKIVVYFAPNTDQGFLDAVTQAVHDTTHAPSIVSISWGSAESSWTAQAMQSMSQAFQDAGMIGVTVCVAAGDGGSSDGATDNLRKLSLLQQRGYRAGNAIAALARIPNTEPKGHKRPGIFMSSNA